MSDEEIRDLLDLGVEDLELGPPLEAGDTWAAGRRIRTQRSWGVGLGAVAAAAAVVGVVWTQGLGGGDVAPQPPADGTLTGPTLLGTPPVTEAPTGVETTEARGEPYFAQFERAGNEAPFQLSGASEPATLEDLQGRWIGPDGEEFVFDEDQFNSTFGGCSHLRGTFGLSEDSQLQAVGDWEGTEDDGECSTQEPLVHWGSVVQREPLLSVDGDTLIISGLDGSTDEPRVPASLTLGVIDEAGFIWEDSEPQGEGRPVALGDDFQLMVSAAAEDMTLTHISELNLESPGLCGQVMAASLRSDDTLLAGAPGPWPVCTEGEDALPPAEPSPVAVALLRSSPTVSFDDGTMVITGTVPESLLDQSTAPPDDTTATSEPPEQGAEDPSVGGDLPGSSGPSTLVVMSEGGWEPTGELTPLTAEEMEGRRWFQVDHDHPGPTLPALPGYGLDFDGSSVHVRECSVDVTVPGALRDGVFMATGAPQWVSDPDPGIDCPVPVYTDEWVQILTSEPRLSTDGEILVIAGGGDDTQLEPVGMALLPDGLSDPAVGPVTTVTAADLTAGLTEVPAEDIGVSDLRDPQPEHATTLSMQDGVVSVDVGCAEPLRGPAWLSHVGPEQFNWQLTAAVPQDLDCAGASIDDAQLWRQMLAAGVFLHRSGDYVILDSLAEPAAEG